MTRSVEDIRSIPDYQAAERRYNATKPTRGYEDRRPLGKRRYHWMRIAKGPGHTYECILYRTAVVIFHPDGRVEVCPKSWTSALTNAFIGAVLPGVQVWHRRGIHALEARGIDHFVQFGSKDASIFLRRGNGGSSSWVVADAPEPEPLWDWRINRPAANKVRARFSEFRRFYKAWLSVLTRDDRSADAVAVVHTNTFAEAFGTREAESEERYHLAVVHGPRINGQPNWHLANTGTVPPGVDSRVVDLKYWHPLLKTPDSFESRGELLDDPEYSMEFLRLIANDQPDDTKVQNFTKAALTLFACSACNKPVLYLATPTYSAKVSTAQQRYDHFIHRAHAKEVLEYVQLKPGQLPTKPYDSWVTTEMRVAIASK